MGILNANPVRLKVDLGLVALASSSKQKGVVLMNQLKKINEKCIVRCNEMEEGLCFSCKKNPLCGDDCGLCESCLLEYPFCYECGENKRNFPYKLCSKCYQQQTNAVVTSQDDEWYLERLDSKKAEYKQAYDLFKLSWVKNPPPPEPVGIYAICNKRLSEHFQKYVHKQRAKGSDSTTSYNFHGTVVLCDLLETNTACSNEGCGVCGIGRIGFDKKLIGTNIPRFKRYGDGFYLAPNSSKCHDYTRGVEDIGVRAQLLCSVASGTRFKTQQDHTNLSGPPRNCDSVYGVKGGTLNYDEIVVFQSDAILPEFIVLYRKDGVHQIAK